MTYMKDHEIIVKDKDGETVCRFSVGVNNQKKISVMEMRGCLWVPEDMEDDADHSVLQVM